MKIKTILIILAGLLIGCSDFNTEPVITSLTADNTTVSPGGTILLTCAEEADNDDDLILLAAKNVGILTSSPTIYKETYGNYQYVFSVEDTAIGNGLGNNETLTLSKGSWVDDLLKFQKRLRWFLIK